MLPVPDHKKTMLRSLFVRACSDEVGVDNWNELDDDYAFLYTNPVNSKKLLVKCLAMNDKLLVDALSEDSPEPVHLEINVGDYVAESGGSNYAAQCKNFEQLVKMIDKEILSKFVGTPKESSPTKPSSVGDYVAESGGSNYAAQCKNFEQLVKMIDEEILSKIVGTPKESSPTKPSSSKTRDTEDTEPDNQRPQPSQGGVPSRFDPHGPPFFPGFEPDRFIRGVPLRTCFDPSGPPGVPRGGPNRFTGNLWTRAPYCPWLKPFGDGFGYI